MANLIKYFRPLLLIISGILIMCTVFATDNMLVNGLLIGKVCWAHWSILVFACVVLLVELTTKNNRFQFSRPDLLVLLLAGIVLLTYDWQLHAEPDKLLFGGQLVVLWFLLRITFQKYPSLKLIFLFILLCTGLVEALLGMGQLYGFAFSNHSQFKVTGSFYNPGPYSGYLALMLPICLGFIFRFGNYKKGTWKDFRTVIYYLSWICLVLILSLLPVGMSRSSWIAGALSCVWVCSMYKGGWRKLSQHWKIHRKMTIRIGSLILLLGIAALTALYQMKKESADGRMLMWKVSLFAIAERPAFGSGLGGFPAAYGSTQADYFMTDNATATEKLVAASPEYAFNEYLQIGVEQGLIGLLFFIIWIIISFLYGVRNKQYGAAGGILALMIFAFSSYPLQLPSFWIALILLSAICITRPINQPNSTQQKGMPYFSIILLIVSGFLFWGQRNTYDTYQEWSRYKAMYNSKAYGAAYKGYRKLYPKLNHKPEFLFEMAQCLSWKEEYKEANTLLKRAIRLSSDPMLYYVMAKNEQQLGNYEIAEKQLIYAIYILPERLYPYYLLTKLYAEPEFLQLEKLRIAADSVLHKEPKVQSTAIKEMREDTRKLLEATTLSPKRYK